MNLVKADKSALEKLHYEWLTNLFALEEEMVNGDSLTKQLQNSVNDLQYQHQLHQLRHQIVLQIGVIRTLTNEVLQWREAFLYREENKLITLQELLQNNMIREKVRKTEQTAFLIKYQVSKLLSLAS